MEGSTRKVTVPLDTEGAVSTHLPELGGALSAEAWSQFANEFNEVFARRAQPWELATAVAARGCMLLNTTLLVCFVLTQLASHSKVAGNPLFWGCVVTLVITVVAYIIGGRMAMAQMASAEAVLDQHNRRFLECGACIFLCDDAECSVYLDVFLGPPDALTLIIACQRTKHYKYVLLGENPLPRGHQPQVYGAPMAPMVAPSAAPAQSYGQNVVMGTVVQAPPRAAPVPVSSPQPRLLQVPIPEGAVAGTTLTVTTPEGQQAAVTVPLGAAPGQVLQISY
mmetsp:Transcript_47029/g.102301  ORF Transcript_47029/g.102301 Transcript_47029/m.102301 type:complete len:280 (+) Transcript_47029:40-879(+)|eukprot:CAMPEP_0204369368 /NCGR_PEP_ID=MMETSP0469-20131031/44901_1 /ASSEMBLY_ACC=CAM_ASM_000384 /TAXON_ID=2969 /ORGANISM="Oxyrrhis marina" /LENGTH=279 /DNA_ID=CAMNT_0051359079 /DNA_START=28 /DNA_END=867 /DNA_ORIENTATION=+